MTADLQQCVSNILTSSGNRLTAVRTENGVTSHNGTYSYDDSGRLTQCVDTATGLTETYTWNNDNTLASSPATGYTRRYEYDEEQPEFVAAGDRNYMLDGSLRLDDLEEQFGIALPRDEAETIAGHLMLRFGRIPRKGERWKGRFADFVIEDATPTAIRKVRMILPEKPEKREPQ